MSSNCSHPACRSRRNRRDHRAPKLPEWARVLNRAQQLLLTKFSLTGQVDPRNKVTEQRPMRKAAWEKRQKEAA